MGRPARAAELIALGYSGIARLPELDAVALRVAELGQAAVGIPLRVDVDALAGAPQLLDHRIEVVDAWRQGSSP